MKLFFALAGVMLAIGLLTLLIWRHFPAEPPCASRDVVQERSADGRIQADVFEVQCADSVSTHVALRPADKPVAARGDVFIAAGSAPVQIRWTGPRQLEVQSAGARVLVSETRWRDVSVSSRP